MEDNQDKYKRKFDNDVSNDLKVLEELYYHAKEDNRYISELKKALEKSGIYEDEEKLETKKLIVKEEFKKTDFYKKGRVIFNKKVEKSYDNVKSFSDMGVFSRNISYALSSGIGKMSNFFEKEEPKETILKEMDISISEIPNHIIRFALSKNPFYHFDNLQSYFPNINSISNFIKSADYLNGLEITLTGSEKRFSELTNSDYLSAIQLLLQTIENEIKMNLTEYEGSDYIKEYIHKVFVDKEIKVAKGKERADGQESLVRDKDWYVYNANYGTSEEKKFVKMFDRRFKHLNKKFKDIYLIRNERIIKIVDALGRIFEPDFVLFLNKKDEEVIYQVFIEPKGKHLIANDKWKEGFLKEIRQNSETINIDSDKYLVTAVPFYNNENENEFKEALEKALNK